MTVTMIITATAFVELVLISLHIARSELIVKPAQSHNRNK